jgi:hypothetical protein
MTGPTVKSYTVKNYIFNNYRASRGVRTGIPKVGIRALVSSPSLSFNTRLLVPPLCFVK